MKWQNKPQWNEVNVLNENLLRVKTDKGWGVIDFNGDVLIPCEHKNITDIAENRFLILGQNNELLQIIIIKENGLATVKYNKLNLKVSKSHPYFSCQRLAVQDEKGKWGFIDTFGNLVIEHEYLEVFPFLQDLAVVKLDNELWSYINPDGNVFDVTKDFSKNQQLLSASSFTKINDKAMALINLNGKLYLIDKQGKTQQLNNKFPNKGIKLNYQVTNFQETITTKDGWEISFHNTAEIDKISKKNEVLAIGEPKALTTKKSLPQSSRFIIGDNGSVKIDSLVIAPHQFSQVIPLSDNQLLVKHNNDNKWGIMQFDPKATKDYITINYNKNFIKRRNSLSRVYTIDENEKIIYLDIDDSDHFAIPSNCIINNKVRLGIMVDGVRLETQQFTVPEQTVYEKKEKNIERPSVRNGTTHTRKRNISKQEPPKNDQKKKNLDKRPIRY